MVELRKRPAPKETAAPAPAAKRSASKGRVSAATTKAKKDKSEAKETSTSTTAAANNKSSDSKPEAETDTKTKGEEADKESSSQFPLSTSSISTTIPLSQLSSKVTLHNNTTTTIAELLSSSSKGIIIFSYPKASTPGCTTQACVFRDSYSHLSDKGYSVFGLSNDSSKSNTTFATKQKLTYDLICDTEGVVSAPLGLKKSGPAKGCVRGVVLLEKVDGNGNAEEGKVGVWFLGGPQKTLDAVLDYLKN